MPIRNETQKLIQCSSFSLYNRNEKRSYQHPKLLKKQETLSQTQPTSTKVNEQSKGLIQILNFLIKPILNHTISSHKHQILSHKPDSARPKATQLKFLQKKMRKKGLGMMPTWHRASQVLTGQFYPSSASHQWDTGGGTACCPLCLGNGTAPRTLHGHGSL